MPRKIGDVTLYDLMEVSSKLRIHLDTLRRYVREHRLVAVRVGKTYLVTEENLKDFLSGKTIQNMLVDLRKGDRRKTQKPVDQERRKSDRRKENLFNPNHKEKES